MSNACTKYKRFLNTRVSTWICRIGNVCWHYGQAMIFNKYLRLIPHLWFAINSKYKSRVDNQTWWNIKSVVRYVNSQTYIQNIYINRETLQIWVIWTINGNREILLTKLVEMFSSADQIEMGWTADDSRHKIKYHKPINNIL